jgi:hypothetical protein
MAPKTEQHIRVWSRNRRAVPDEYQDVENYHQIKDKYFESKGIQILHIREEDWIKDPEQSLLKVWEFLRK